MNGTKSPETIVSSQHFEYGLSKNAFRRFYFYAKALQKLKMKDGDISCLISDFYYDSIESFKKAEAKEKL